MLLPDPSTTTGLVVLTLMLVLNLASHFRIGRLVREAGAQVSGVPSGPLGPPMPICRRAANDEGLVLTGVFFLPFAVGL